MRIAVLDIGGTTIKAGIVENEILSDRKEYETNAKKGGAHVMATAISILKEYLPFDCIGISTAGQVDSQKGMIKYANSNIPEYTGMKIREKLEKEFAVSVAVENDVNAAAIGEAYFGAGIGYKDFLCLTYGTGVGGAIVMGGEVYRGTTFSAGEMGALVVHPEERNVKQDMFSGCYEKYASTTALVKKISAIDKSLTDGKKIFENLHRSEVKKAVDDWIMEIVCGLTSLIHVFNPSCVILGGGVMKQEYILKTVKELLYQNIMESFNEVVILTAQLENQAGLYGAAKSAMEYYKKTNRNSCRN